MGKRNITLKDLSERLGFSVSTISRALKDHHDISQETKYKVQQLAKKLNYIPNYSAQSLKNSQTKTIGVIIPNLLLDFSSKIINGMIHQSRKEGYRLVISESGHSPDLEKDILENMIRSGVDGILLSLTNNTKNIDHVLLAKEKCPIVLYDKVSDKIPCTRIIVDNETGAYNATKHLIDQGRKKIVFIKGTDHSFNAKKRFEGYLRALKDRQIKVDKNLIPQCGTVCIQEGTKLVNQMISKRIEFDAIFAVTDDVAIGAIKALKKHNIIIPKQVAVVGFSNSKSTTIIEPNLTSVDQPGYTIGIKAIEYLLKELKLAHQTEHLLRTTPKTIELKTNLIKRESS